MSRGELNLLVDFFKEHEKMHLITDEIYYGMVFSSLGFVSGMEVLKKRNELKDSSNYDDAGKVWNRVHVVYSFSKDLGLLGLRLGAIYTENDDVVSVATKVSSFSLLSSQTQCLLSAMLEDNKFKKLYNAENEKRLKQLQEMLVLDCKIWYFMPKEKRQSCLIKSFKHASSVVLFRKFFA